MEKISKEKKLKSFVAKAAGTAVLAAGMLVGGGVANAESNNRIANALAGAAGRDARICKSVFPEVEEKYAECVEYGKDHGLNDLALEYYDGSDVVPEALCRVMGSSSKLRLSICIPETHRNLSRLSESNAKVK